MIFLFDVQLRNKYDDDDDDAAQCIVIGHVCLCVGGSVTKITRNCVHRSLPNWVCN